MPLLVGLCLFAVPGSAGCVWEPVAFLDLPRPGWDPDYVYKGPAPSAKGVAKEPAFAEAKFEDKRVVVVTDISVGRLCPDGRGSYLSLFDSKRATKKAAMAVAAYWTSQGLPKPEVALMTVGGILDPAQEQQVCRYPFGEAFAAKPPLWAREESWGDRHPSGVGTQAGAVELVNEVFLAFRAYAQQDKGKEEADVSAREAALRKAIQRLGRRYGCDYVLVVAGCGRIVTADDIDRIIWPQILLTSTVSAAASLGMFSIGAATYPVSFLTTVALIADAHSGEPLWLNAHPVVQNDLPDVGGVRLYGGRPLNNWYAWQSVHLDTSLADKVNAPVLRRWASERSNVFWLNWAKHLLYYALHDQETK